MIYQNHLKRILDIMLSGFGLVVLSPVFVIVAIFVRLLLGAPVVFRQKRPGLNENIYTMFKFRTMTNERDDEGNLLPDSERLTAFGKWLRSTSLDELPELFNIIKGDMSIVGPRPQLVRDMVFMTDQQRRRHTVLPGLTGWAQVNGRNSVNWEEKLKLDLEYIDNITLLRDIKIILMTVVKVFRKEDISASGMDTAEDYGDYLVRIGQVSHDEYREKQKQSCSLIERASR